MDLEEDLSFQNIRSKSTKVSYSNGATAMNQQNGISQPVSDRAVMGGFLGARVDRGFPLARVVTRRLFFLSPGCLRVHPAPPCWGGRSNN
jgi:hypothetical protein